MTLLYRDFVSTGQGGFDLTFTRIDTETPFVDFRWEGGRLGELCSVPSTTGYTDNNPSIRLANGKKEMFYYLGGQKWITESGWQSECPGKHFDNFRIYSPDGRTYEFHGDFGLKKITDKNGNYAVVHYDRTTYNQEVQYRLSHITTNDGRTVNFSMGGYLNSAFESRKDAMQSGTIKSISSGSKKTEYQYKTHIIQEGGDDTREVSLLEKVIYAPDQQWQYEYHIGRHIAEVPTYKLYRIKTVTHPAGGRITYDYGLNSGNGSQYACKGTYLKSKTISTGGSWAYNYDRCNTSSNDITTVTTPQGFLKYEYFGPNQANASSIWKIGRLLKKRINYQQTETYTWNSQKVASQRSKLFTNSYSNWPRYTSSAIYRPILTNKVINRLGALHTSEYSNHNPYGSPQTIKETGPTGDKRTTTLTYYNNSSKRILNQVRNVITPQAAVYRSFDTQGNLSSLTENGITTRYYYDTQGNLTQMTEPGYRVTRYKSYYRGIPRREEQPENVVVQRTVDSNGHVTSVTNGEGHKTSFRHDSLGRKTYVDYPQGYSATIAYNAKHTTYRRGSLSVSTNLDPFGRVAASTTGGIRTNYRYDAFGRKTFESQPNSYTRGTNYSYNVLNLVDTITHNDGKTIKHYYGNNQVRIHDERNKQTTYQYRSYGDPDETYLTKIYAPVSTANVTIERDGRDRVKSVTQDGVKRSYGYNTQNHLITVTEPERPMMIFGRDYFGNMTQKYLNGQHIATYTYDKRDRLKNINYRNAATPDASFQYDRRDNLTYSAQGSGVTIITAPVVIWMMKV